MEFVDVKTSLAEYRMVYHPIRDLTVKNFEKCFEAGARQQHSRDLEMIQSAWELNYEIGDPFPAGIKRQILTDVHTRDLYQKYKKVYGAVRKIYDEADLVFG